MGIIKVIIFKTNAGKQPLLDWLDGLEENTQVIIDRRITRVKSGNLGDCKKIKGVDVWEIRIDYGPGFRLYFGKQGISIVILLVGGPKRSQKRDIAKAQEYWLEFKNKDK